MSVTICVVPSDEFSDSPGLVVVENSSEVADGEAVVAASGFDVTSDSFAGSVVDPVSPTDSPSTEFEVDDTVSSVEVGEDGEDVSIALSVEDDAVSVLVTEIGAGCSVETVTSSIPEIEEESTELSVEDKGASVLVAEVVTDCSVETVTSSNPEIRSKIQNSIKDLSQSLKN